MINLEALSHVEEQFRLIFDNAAVGMTQTDVATGRFLRVNDALCQLTGYSCEQLLELTFLDITHPDEREEYWRDFRIAMTKESPVYQVEKRLVRIDGHVIWVRVHVGLIQGRRGQPPRTATVVVDVTADKQAEAANHALHEDLEGRLARRTAQLALLTESLRAEVLERKRLEKMRANLIAQLMSAQEEERRRIARELHDQMGQLLAALVLGLKAMEDTPPDGSAWHERLRRLRDLADQIGRELHDLALALRPTALDDVGLTAALAHFAEDWSRRVGVPLDYHAGLSRNLPREVETVLYRVVQEALTNVAKHAKARHVSLILEEWDEIVAAIVEDDGQGFRVPGPVYDLDSRKCLGLIGMRERLQAVRGTLEIESTPGVGTTLYARVPVPQHTAEA